jgi:mevalonate kinase
MADSFQTPGKLMLFGEYAVLAGSRALAIPLPGFFGYWQSASDGQPDQRLIRWYLWLLQQADRGHLKWSLDLEAMGEFFYGGGRFSSTIPTGYGLGSSGALVAAVARRWSVDLPSNPDDLMAGLAMMESYFHGQSSGLDPMVSLLNQAILIREDKTVEAKAMPQLPPHLFLVDSGIPRNTGPLVDQFKKRLMDDAFHRELQEALLPANHQAIDALIQGDISVLEAAFRRISALQRDNFAAMIPAQLQAWWQGSAYCLKLCGAGGGGYFLGYAYDGTLPDLPFACTPLSSLTHFIDTTQK